MAENPFDQFAEDAGNPFDQFDAPAKDTRRTSQAMGFVKGARRVIDNVAPLTDWLYGSEDRLRGSEKTERVIAEESQTRRPGRIGEFAGSMAMSGPAMFIGGPATSGAIQGYAASEADDFGGRVGDAALGAAGGKIVGVALNRAGRFLSPAADPAVRRLAAEGVELTPGQIKGGRALTREDKRMSIPGVGDDIAEARDLANQTWNLSTVNKALRPLNVKVPQGVEAGHEAVAEAHRIVANAYDAVIPKLSVKLNPQQFLAQIGPAAQSLGKKELDTLQKTLSRTLGNGQLAGQALKTGQGELRRLSAKFSAAADGYQQELGKVLGDVDRFLSAEMLRQNPGQAQALQRVNRAFRGLAVVEDAAKGADDGLMTTAGLKQAALRSDKSARKNASAQGKAFMQDHVKDSRKVMGGKTPNSGTADRRNEANWLMQLYGAALRPGYAMDSAVTNALLGAPAPVRHVGNALRRLADPAGRTAGAAVATRPSDR